MFACVLGNGRMYVKVGLKGTCVVGLIIMFVYI